MECASDLGHSLACKGNHEELAATHQSIVERNAQVQDVSSRSLLVLPAFLGVMGLLFAGFGLIYGRTLMFATVVGVALMLFAAIMYVVNKRAWGRRPRA